MADVKKDQERDELFRRIYKIATDLVHAGHVAEWDFKSYVLGTMFYRYISENFTAYINEGEHAAGNKDFDYAKMPDAEAETAREGLVQEKGFFILPSELFCNVLARADKDDNLNETLERVFNHIESSAASGDAENDFAGLFDDFDVNSKAIGETVAKRNKVLVELLNGVAQMPLFSTEGSNPDLFGDAYEYLMGMYAANAGKKGGQYFTPADVSELLARLGTIGKTKINKVYDPACGSGSLLLKVEKVLGKDNIEQVAKKGKEAWNQVLGKIEVEGGNLDQYRTFYSCLYRSLLFPRKFYELDANGRPIHYSPYNGQVLPGYMYTDTGFWDTFRCLFPLLNLMYPSVNKEMQEGLINTYKESGFFPEWASPGQRGCMVGNNSASVLVDAYMKGVKVDDIKTLYEGLLHGTENVHPEVSSTGRLGHEYYNKLGYVPYDVKINENAARTLEYAYDDWCIYQLGKALKKPKKEIEIFAKRAMNYKNLYDPEYKLMRGKNEDGTFQSPFNPLKWGDAFTEGNSWHYTWSVFHDPQGLIDLMGGKDGFNQMMDSVFILPPVFDDSYYGGVIHEIREMQIMNMGNYAHGNQPIQHMLYMYNYSGQPWKAQHWIREVMDKLYTPAPDGYCGDEDNGQTSAWYVFSSMGFYPVCPGTDEYILGTPYFKQMKLHLENGKTITISAPENGDDKRYISSMTLNGKEHTKNYLTHEELMNGASITFKMAAQPNEQRGTKEADLPYSFSNEFKKKK